MILPSMELLRLLPVSTQIQPMYWFAHFPSGKCLAMSNQPNVRQTFLYQANFRLRIVFLFLNWFAHQWRKLLLAFDTLCLTSSRGLVLRSKLPPLRLWLFRCFLKSAWLSLRWSIGVEQARHNQIMLTWSISYLVTFLLGQPTSSVLG